MPKFVDEIVYNLKEELFDLCKRSPIRSLIAGINKEYGHVLILLYPVKDMDFIVSGLD